jgi:hypothetical protein
MTPSTRSQELANQDTFTCGATLAAPSLGKLWTFSNGSMTGVMPTPPGKKRYQPQTYEFTFESCIPAPIPT